MPETDDNPIWTSGYDQGIADTRERLGDAIIIVEEELAHAWVPDPVINAMYILSQFAREED